MIFKKDSIVEVKKGLKFIVLDIKNYEKKEVALLQGLEDGVLRFAVEKINKSTKEAYLEFINDTNLIMSIAKEFDKQDGKI